MRAAQGKRSIPLTEDDKDFVNESKRKRDVPVTGKQGKRKKVGHTETVPEPDITTKTIINIPITETDGSAVTTSGNTNLLVQSKSGTPMCEKVPESPVRHTQTNILSTIHDVIIPTTGDDTYPTAVSSTQSGYSVTGMANNGSTVMPALPDFYNPESPLFQVQDDFIHEIVTGNINSSVSSINSPSSSVGTFTTAPTFAVPQPVNFNVLNTLPGGANLGLLNQGLGGSPLAQPNATPQITTEWQRAVSDTLSKLLFNQQLILNELKSIKQNTGGTGVNEGASNLMQVLNENGEQEPLSVQEIISRLTHHEETTQLGEPESITMDDLTKLKEDQLKTKGTQAHLAVTIMNALTTKEQRRGKSVLGTKSRPALDNAILSKIREYYFTAYPCNEDDDEAAIWKQCIHCMNNRLKKYDKA